MHLMRVLLSATCCNIHLISTLSPIQHYHTQHSAYLQHTIQPQYLVHLFPSRFSHGTY